MAKQAPTKNPHLYLETTNEPIKPPMIMTKSKKTVVTMSERGSPVQRRISRRSIGVVMVQSMYLTYQIDLFGCVNRQKAPTHQHTK